MKQLVVALDAVREGDFTYQLPSDWTGLEGKVADKVVDKAKDVIDRDR